MDKEYEKQYHQAEQAHWWFVARREAIVRLLRSWPPDSRILDIGCSGGVLMRELMRRGFQDVTGIDFSREAIDTCTAAGIPNVFQMDAHRVTFPMQSFDVIISSDCLEHLERDGEALKNWYSMLKPGGVMILFVPAFQFLWSDHDVINHHYRRYTVSGLSRLLRSAGFRVIRRGYWNFLLFFPAALVRILRPASTHHPRSDLDNPPRCVNGILKTVMKVENFVFRHVSFPIGISAFVLSGKESRDS